MFGTIIAIVLVEFVLSLFLPSIDVALGSYDLRLDMIIVLLLAGYVGGMRFAFRQTRRMQIGERFFCTIISYVVITVIPPLLFSGLIYLAREQPDVAQVLTEANDPSAILTFFAAYIMLDALPHMTATFLGISAAQIGARSG